jgi:glycosyltransferase involved in cell wall biosynthesis
VLIVHNMYRQRGGEDAVVESESAMLRERGHDVELFTRHNDDIEDGLSPRLAAGTIWSQASANALREVARRFRPDVMHVHNTTPLISPSVFWAADELGLPSVMTLHNFRLLCPQAMFLREGKVCEDCLGRLPWRGVVRRCYRGSLVQSAVLGATIVVHRKLETWDRKVTRYIALNEFCRQKFIDGGLPADRIVVKPNHVDLPCPPAQARDGFLFAGRLSEEKGVAVLADAVRQLPQALLSVAGTGPEEARFDGMANVRRLGWLANGSMRSQMVGASALVMPSLWYENFPRTLVEAFASALPVIASRIGALGELVQDGLTGLLFNPGDAQDLRDKMHWAMEHPDAMLRMGQNARRHYESLYTADENARQLTAIYADAIEARRRQAA